jgi:hypothetical protein
VSKAGDAPTSSRLGPVEALVLGTRSVLLVPNNAEHVVLPIPPGRCTNSAAGPPGASKAVSRAFLGPADQAPAAAADGQSETEPPGPGLRSG